MRYRRAAPFIPILALSLGVSGAAPAHADYGFVDEQSVTNGAQLYEVFCSDCHGSDPANRYDQLYAPDADGNAADEYEKMVEIVQQEESAQLIVVPEEDEPWPEWAERPDPEAEEEPDEKTELMNTLTALIDEAHGIKPSAASGSAPGASLPA